MSKATATINGVNSAIWAFIAYMQFSTSAVYQSMPERFASFAQTSFWLGMTSASLAVLYASLAVHYMQQSLATSQQLPRTSDRGKE